MTEIIAEIGINHNGNINLAHELIRQAAIAGADVAKFQAYSVDKLFHPEHGEDPNEEIWKAVGSLEFSYNDFVKIKEWCDEENIEFMCSVFDEERLDWMERLGVKRHKIASRVTKLNRDLAKKIIGTGKECLVSLGFGSSKLETQYSNVKYLYCVSEYPTEYKSLELPMDFIKEGYWGFSDHSLGIEASLVAIVRGAKVVEKHFTINKAAEGFDHICSVDPAELNDLVKYSKRISVVLKQTDC